MCSGVEDKSRNLSKIVWVLLSALVERVGVSRIRDFLFSLLQEGLFTEFTYLCHKSDSCESCDSSDCSDSSERSGNSDNTYSSDQKTIFFTKKLFFKPNFFHNKNLPKNLKTQIVIKPKNSNCVETQKLKLWWNSKSQIIMKLKNSNCDET